MRKKSGKLKWMSLNLIHINEEESIFTFILTPTDKDKYKNDEIVSGFKDVLSNEEYKELVESLPATICETDLNGNIVYANDYSFKKFKFKKERLGDQVNILDFLFPEDKKRAIEGLKRMSKSKEPLPQIYKLKKADGTLFYGRILSCPKYKGGEIVGFRTIINDISKLITARKRLSKSKSRYRLISENANELILIINNKMQREYVNEAALKKILGYRKEEIEDIDPMEFIYPEDFDRAVEAFKRGRKDGEVVEKLRFVRKNDEIVWVEILGKVFKDYDGKNKGLLICRDITERKTTQKELKESEKKYRHLFENSPFMIVLLNQDANIIDVNDEFLHNSKLLFNDVIHHKLNDLKFYKPINYDVFKTNFKELLEKGRIESFKIGFMTKEGERLTLKTKLSKINVNGEDLIQVIFQDITKAIKNQARLKALLALNKMVGASEREIVRFVIKKSLELTESALGFIGFVGEDGKIDKFFHYSRKKINTEILEFKQTFVNHIDFVKYFTIQETSNLIINKPKEIKKYFDIKIDPESFIRTLIAPISIDNEIKVIASVADKKSKYTKPDLFQLVLLIEGMWNRIQEKQAKLRLKESEKKYRELIESSSLAIVEYNLKENKIDYINPKVEELLGYKKENLYQKKFLLDIIPPKDLKKFFNLPEKERIEFRIQNKKGKLHWLSADIISKVDTQGNPIGFRFWCKDISEIKIYEKFSSELNSNFLNFTINIEKNIVLLLNTLSKLLRSEIAIYFKKLYMGGKPTYFLVMSNGEAYEISAERLKDDYPFLFKSLQYQNAKPILLNDLDRTEHLNNDPLIKKFNITACYGISRRTHAEKKSILYVFYRTIPKISNEYKTFLNLISDAIEVEISRKELLIRLEKQNKKLREINQIKTELLSRVSHELKTPLISIKGYTELLLEFYNGGLNNDVLSIIEQIKNGSSRLENLVDTLLECSLLDKGKLRLSLDQENLSKIVEEVIEELDGLRKLRKLELTNNIDQDFLIKCDKKRIKEVISNLFLNSIKYTPPRGKISLKLEETNKKLLFSIKDTGIGLTEDEIPKLFTQFGKIERYGQGWDVDTEGAGLGLYIAKKIISLHNGDLWVESEGRNKGSKFSFSLPKNLNF